MYDLDLEVLSMEKKSSPNERPSIEISQNWKGSLNQLSILIAMSFPSTHLDPRLTILSQYSKASVFLKKITILRDFDAIIAICPKKIMARNFGKNFSKNYGKGGWQKKST